MVTVVMQVTVAAAVGVVFGVSFEVGSTELSLVGMVVVASAALLRRLYCK